MTSSYFRSVLFSLHLFVFLTNFLLELIYSRIAFVVQKTAWYHFNFLKFTKPWFVTSNVIYLRDVPCTLEIKCILLLLGGVPCRYRLGSSGPMCHLRLAFPYFLSEWSVLWHEWGIKVPTIIMLLSVSPFTVVSICLIFWCTLLSGACIFIIVISTSWIGFWSLCSILPCVSQWYLL